MEAIFLKKGKERVFQKRHHWIFSGAIASFPNDYSDGDLAPICSAQGDLLGYGFFNRRCSLSGRVVSFGKEEPYGSLIKTFTNALDLRQSLLDNVETTACRLVNGEGDGLPGLIIDKYGPYVVVQIGALGVYKLLPFFMNCLKERLLIEGMYHKSLGSSLKEEGLLPQESILWGDIPDLVSIKENGIRYDVDIKKGQKTGFFLDQREMRHWIQQLSAKRRVLNCFCYTGGFTLAALKGGAELVDSVDTSTAALELCRKNVLLNGFSIQKQNFYEENVFDFLQKHHCEYDLVILDPPAFAKKKKDIPNALKGYKNMFRLTMQKMPKKSLILLSSCSYYISEEMFESAVIDVAHETKREIRILGRHRHSIDHPINPFHPESSYLKSILVGL